MWKCIETVGTVLLGGQYRQVELKQIQGTGKELLFHLTVEGRRWGAIFKGTNGWIAQDNFTKEELESLVTLIEEALAYDRLDLDLTVPVGDDFWQVNIFESRPGIYVIYVRKWGYDYYRGRIWKEEDGRWTGEINFGAWEDITSYDLPVLGDIIEEEKKAR